MNRCLAAALAAVVGWPASPAAARVILNEVLADPAGSEHHEEFVELRNTGPDSVDLAGWRLGDADELDASSTPDRAPASPPGRFALVVDGSYRGNSAAYDSVRMWAVILTIEDRSFGRAGWSNSTPERVLLRDPSGAMADSFGYDPSRGIAGHSWERRRGAPPAWQASYLAGGTPGRANSVDQRPRRRPAASRSRSSPAPPASRVELLCRLPAAPALLAVTVFDAEGAGSRGSPTGGPPPSRPAWPGTASTAAGGPSPRGSTWSSPSPAPGAAPPAASGS